MLKEKVVSIYDELKAEFCKKEDLQNQEVLLRAHVEVEIKKLADVYSTKT